MRYLVRLRNDPTLASLNFMSARVGKYHRHAQTQMLDNQTESIDGRGQMMDRLDNPKSTGRVGAPGRFFR